MDAKLFTLLRQFYALTPTYKLQFPKSCLPEAINHFLVNNILSSPHFQKYPPSHQYQKRFWKWIIQNLEDLTREGGNEERDGDFEIDPRIYDHYLALDSPADWTMKMSRAGPDAQAPPSQTYITHFWKPEDTLFEDSSSASLVDVASYQSTTLLESRNIIESGTTGLRTWLASFVLSQYLILHPELLSSKRILELGSGIGFLGIIVASLQQHRNAKSLSSGSLWLSDVNDTVLARCKANLELPCNASSAHPDVNYLQLNWSDSIDEEQAPCLASLIHEKIKPELILGADIVFDPSLIPALVGTLKIALQSVNRMDDTQVALIALTLRNETTMNKFLSHAQESSLSVEELDVGFLEMPFSESVEANSSPQSVKLFRIRTAA